MGIAQEPRDRLLIDGQGLGFLLRPAGLGFVAQRFYGRDAQHVAVELTGQIVVLEHDVERLIPRHVVEHDGQCALDVGIEYHVQAADLVNQAEEIFQIHILQVHGNRFARVLGSGDRGDHVALAFVLRSQIHRRLDGLSGRSLSRLGLHGSARRRQQIAFGLVYEFRRRAGRTVGWERIRRAAVFSAAFFCW